MPDAATDTHWSQTAQHNVQMTHILDYATFNSAQGEARSPWLLFSDSVINSEQVKGGKYVQCVCVCVCVPACVLYNLFWAQRKLFFCQQKPQGYKLFDFKTCIRLPCVRCGCVYVCVCVCVCVWVCVMYIELICSQTRLHGLRFFLC